MEKNLLIDMGVSLPEGTNWDEVAMAITEAIIAIVEQRDGQCGGSVLFQEFDYDAIDAELGELEDEDITGPPVISATQSVTVHGG